MQYVKTVTFKIEHPPVLKKNDTPVITQRYPGKIALFSLTEGLFLLSF